MPSVGSRWCSADAPNTAKPDHGGFQSPKSRTRASRRRATDICARLLIKSRRLSPAQRVRGAASDAELAFSAERSSSKHRSECRALAAPPGPALGAPIIAPIVVRTHVAPELRALQSLGVDEISAWGWRSREASREKPPRSALRAPELRWHDERRQSRWIALWQALSVAPRGAKSRGVR